MQHRVRVFFLLFISRLASSKDKLLLRRVFCPDSLWWLHHREPTSASFMSFLFFFCFGAQSLGWEGASGSCDLGQGNKGVTRLIGRHIGFVEKIHLNLRVGEVAKILSTTKKTKPACAHTHAHAHAHNLAGSQRTQWDVFSAQVPSQKHGKVGIAWESWSRLRCMMGKKKTQPALMAMRSEVANQQRLQQQQRFWPLTQYDTNLRLCMRVCVCASICGACLQVSS